MAAPPVTDLAALARLRRVTEIRVDPRLTGLDGFTHVEGDGLVIRVRDTSSARGRFTVAHEIGHSFFYDLDGARPLARTSFGAKEEGWCHVFARCLLMPRLWLEAVTQHIDDPSLMKLFLLADAYRVSPEAMAWRLQDLGTWPTLVLIGRRDAEGWRLTNVTRQQFATKGRTRLHPGAVHPLAAVLDVATPGNVHKTEQNLPTLRFRRAGRFYVDPHVWTESIVYGGVRGVRSAITLVHLEPTPKTLDRLQRSLVPDAQLHLPLD